MNFRLVFKLTGKTLLVEAGALLLPLWSACSTAKIPSLLCPLP